jgi:hypothetical protein
VRGNRPEQATPERVIQMAVKMGKEVVGKSGAAYKIDEAADCGAQFVAITKTVKRTNGDKVKRLVFNRDDIDAIGTLFK